MAARKRSTTTTTKRRTRKAGEQEGTAANEAQGESGRVEATGAPSTGDGGTGTPVVAARPYPLQTSAGQPVSIVHVVAELAPFARTGGLGEAVANLAKAQAKAAAGRIGAGTQIAGAIRSGLCTPGRGEP